MKKTTSVFGVYYDDTGVACRYDEARQLSQATMDLWLGAMAAHVATEDVRVVLDVGCGTGRFSGGLADRFDAQVIGVDPSQSMLAQAKRKLPHGKVSFCIGDAERIPAEEGSTCMIFLSMVYHHIQDTGRAAREFRRVLRDNGLLCIRNSTVDLLHRVPYLKHFPSARKFNQRRLPSQRDVIATMQSERLMLLRHEVIEQEFARSPDEYIAKIRRRGLSDLVALGEAEFQKGVRSMKEAAANESGPVIEPVDLFVFRKVA